MEMTEIERMNTEYRYKEIAIKDINEFKKTVTYEVFSGKFIKDIKYRVTYFSIFKNGVKNEYVNLVMYEYFKWW